MDSYFQCAIGEEGFTQELYETDFFLKKNFIEQTIQEMKLFSLIPVYNLYVNVMGMIAIRDTLALM